MQIEIKQVVTKNDLKEFIFLPEKIHATHTNWVPPVYMDEWFFYSPKHNKALQHSDTVLFTAHSGKNILGRIMGIINNQYNQKHGEKTARFFNFDCFDNNEASDALLTAIEEWAHFKGMNKIIGPFGFSDKDPQGIQIEGFEHMPVIATATNMPYLKNLIEKKGYNKKVDCVVYQLDIPQEVPENYLRIYKRAIENKKIVLKEFTSQRQLKPYIVPVFRLVNETYKNIFGFQAMDEEEMQQLAKRYLPLLTPSFTKLITDVNNNPVAFVISNPDISKGIIKAKGKLFPFGFLHILLSARRSTQLDLLLGAIKEEYRSTGVMAILGTKIFETAISKGMTTMDSHLILETNLPMRGVMEKLGGKIYKRYRIYEKDI